MHINHLIVMAASSPKHIEPLVRTRPKAMLPVMGKPMIARVMDAFYKAGIRRFTVVVGEREGAVVEWLSTKWHTDARLTFAPQGHKRGTASTLFATRGLIDGPFVITPCDTLVPDDHVDQLLQYFETYQVDATVLSICSATKPGIGSVSVLLDPRGQVVYVSEDMAAGHQGNLAALPIYGFTPTVLNYLDRVPVKGTGERPLTTAIQMMIDDHLPVGTVETTWFKHIITPDDFLEANLYHLSQMGDSFYLPGDLPDSVEIRPPVYIDSDVTIGEGCVIGPNVYLETGSVIGRKVELENSVVLSRQIASRQQIKEQLVYQDL